MEEFRKDASEGSGGNFIYKFDAIGTKWEIETNEPLASRSQESIHKRIELFDCTYSRFRSDSLVSQIADAPQGGRFEFPTDSIALFTLYDQLYTLTEGAVDPLVGRDLELLGYDKTYSFKQKVNPEQLKAEPGKRVSWSKDIVREGTLLITKRPLVIDVGATGKGYLVDIVSGILREAGFTDFVVDGSGDLVHSGESAYPIGLEHPFEPQLVMGVANLKNSALCASANNRRTWGEGLHHVLNAQTGIPVQNVVATWAIAPDAMTADGLATALFFTSGKQLAEKFHFSFVRMFADGRAEYSQNFDGEIFF
ncbi:FAD:protein FMN transferase [Planococcus citreus]|uniref:FAD:protein FMN transferase n=1 Tax=Planococcus citreus TaxID=1373 RepID=A0A497YIH9_9BACL|nr:FAD:protein FMN transferase [Planococcus citreus]RLJ86999.1 thiamine biosynthesis lipoprotein [Planococcus citreus]